MAKIDICPVGGSQLFNRLAKTPLCVFPGFVSMELLHSVLPAGYSWLQYSGVNVEKKGKDFVCLDNIPDWLCLVESSSDNVIVSKLTGIDPVLNPSSLFSNTHTAFLVKVVVNCCFKLYKLERFILLICPQ